MAKVFWFTGLSGSGKTTLGKGLLKQLPKNTLFLDGDIIRTGLCSDLGFSMKDRDENLRRIAEVARIGYCSNLFVVCCFISPLIAQRKFARSLIDVGDFVEIYLNTNLEVCERRDVKGMYKKAREGIIKDFTGVGSPYEPPILPEVSLDTDLVSIDVCLEAIMATAYTKPEEL